MCGIAMVNRLKIERYAAQHLGRDNWILAEHVWRREDLHGFEKEVCTTRSFPEGLFHDEYFPESQDE